MALVLSASDSARIQWVIDNLITGSAGKFIDSTSIEQLALVFGQECGFRCGCPGTFQEGMRDTPFATLLTAMLCKNITPAPHPIVPVVQLPCVDLLTAKTYAILANTAVTNTGASVINGDLGISAGSAVTGFDVIDAGPGHVNGAYHITDAAAAQAKLDLTAAYLLAQGLTPSTLIAADIAGMTITPGNYFASSSLQASTSVTFDGQNNPAACFVFQIESSWELMSGASINLINGALASRIFFKVGSSATLDTTSSMQGNILALTSISVLTGAQVHGRLLARNGAVTLQSNTISIPA
jgi:hypothetical protein